MIGRVIYIVSLKCHFNIEQHSVERSRLPPNLQIDKEPESSEAILLNVGKICRGISKLFTLFGKKKVFNRGRYLKRFCTYKKINIIFLKFNHSLLKSLKMPKIVEIGYIFPTEKRDSKTRPTRI